MESREPGAQRREHPMTRYAALFHPDPTRQPTLLASLHNLVAHLNIVNEVTLSLNLDNLTSHHATRNGSERERTTEPEHEHEPVFAAERKSEYETIRTIGRHLYRDTAISVQIGVANTLFAATLAALQPRRVTFINDEAAFLANHPIEILAAGLDLELLHRLGITTVGHFQSLDPLLVRDRFGPLGAFAHQISRGYDPVSTMPFTPEVPFLAERTLDSPLITQEPIIFLAHELTHSLTELLHQRNRTCMAFVLRATQGDGVCREQTYTLTHPWCEEEIWPRLQSTIESWVLDNTTSTASSGERILDSNGHYSYTQPEEAVVDPDRQGITKLTIEARQTLPRAGLPLRLWGTSPTRNTRIAGAASRIATLLNDQTTPVLRAFLQPGRTYAERSTWIPFDAIAKDQKAPSGLPSTNAPWPGSLPPPHPATILSPPQSAELHDAQHQLISVNAHANLSATPAYITIEGYRHDVINWAGPWPLEQHWWHPNGGDRLAHLQVTTTDNSAYLLAVQEQRWWLVGKYD